MRALSSPIVIARACLALACIVILAACSTQAPPSPSAQQSIAASAIPTVAPAAIVGVWTRTQDCAGQLAAFAEAGLAESHLGWVTGNWFPEGAEPDPADPCNGSRPAEEHSHFFTDAGEFGSYDADGEQVDNGDYELVDDGTLSFPSHAAEFGFDGDVLVDFAVDGDSATFEVQMPSGCADACADAYAWALSAFYEADPWDREPGSG
jgi:hypothetical protein